MHPLIKSITANRIFRFICLGTLGIAIDFALFYALYFLLEWHIVMANLVSCSAGLTCSFWGNRAWTFNDTVVNASSRLWWSLMFAYFGLMLSTGLVWGLATMMSVMAAKIIAVLVVLVYNYAVNRFIVLGMRY